MKYFRSAGLTFACGALLAFAYPNMFGQGLCFLTVVAFGFFYYLLLQEKKIIPMLILSLLFSLGFSSFGFYWIPQTLSTFGGVPVVLGYITSLFFSFIVLPYLWPQTILIFFLRKKNIHHYQLLILIACIHTILEQIIPSQFPVWIGHSVLSNNTLLPLTSYFGAGIYSFALLLIALFLPSFLTHYKKFNPMFLLGFFILLFDFISGLFMHYPTTQNTTSNQKLNLRIVQANIGNFLKISSEDGEMNSISEVYQRYEKLSFASPVNFDLLLWPETAIPTLFNTDHWTHKNFFYYPNIKKIIDQLPLHAGFIFGGYDQGFLTQSSNDAKSEYNTAFFYQDEKLATYYKIKLIPFGETLPFGSWNSSLASYFPGVSLFAQGSHYKSFTLYKQQHPLHFITPICYELLDTFFIRNFLNSQQHIDFIANLTNDSWYGDTAEPWQHLFLTRWRALEFRRPIIRSTNTGITTLIDEQGKVTNYLAVQDRNFLDIILHLHSHPITFYQQYGNILLYLLILAIIVIYFVKPAFIKSWRRRTPNKTTS